MAGKTAILKVRIIGDAKDSVKAMSEAEKASASLQSGIDKAAAGATVALGAIGAGAKVAVDAASRLQQSQGAVAAVFGESAQQIATLGEDAATRLGLAQSEYGELASLIGSQLKNMGVSAGELAPQTDQLISLGSDLAATYGGTVSDAVSAVSSLLRGERDPIERYGVSLKQADIDARLAADGMADLEGEALKQATTQATLALLMEQTASATGMFASEADTLAGQQERANAKFEDAKAKIGTQLLPVVTDLMNQFSQLGDWMSENTETVTALGIALGVMALGIIAVKVATSAYQAVQTLQTAAQWAQNAAWLSSPITWIVIGVMAIIAAVILLAMHWDEVMAWIQTTSADVGKWIADTWNGFINWIVEIFTGFGDWVAGIFHGIYIASAKAAVWILEQWNKAVLWVQSKFAQLGAWIDGIWQGAVDAAVNAALWVYDQWNKALQWVKGLFSDVANWANETFGWVIDGISGVIEWVKSAISWVSSLLGSQETAASNASALSTASTASVRTMAYSAPMAMSTYAMPAATTTFSATTFSAPTALTSSSVSGARRDARRDSGQTVNITVNGALDPNAVARQIRGLLRTDAQYRGEMVRL